MLLQVRDLRVSFRLDKTETFEALKGVSFDVPHHATVALVGESGSGKSVTSLAVMGLLPAPQASVGEASSIRFQGRDLLALSPAQRRALCGKDIGIIFQDPMSSLNPVLTVGFQIGEVLRKHMGMGPRQARERTLGLLAEVGLPQPEKKIDAYPHHLSGGQQQRVMIAMAVACEPTLLIADEPTTALDVTVQRSVMELIRSLQSKRRMSVLFITHDLALVAEFADHVVVMRHGEVRETGTVRQVLEQPADAYTRALLECRPRLDRRPVRLPVIEDHLCGKFSSDRLPDRRRGYAAGDTPLLVVDGLCKSFFVRDGLFRTREFKAVQDVSFILPRGRTLGIVGESGCGKSTLGLTLVRLHQATSGKVHFEGKDLLAMGRKEYMAVKRRIQIIFQNPYASLNPRFTVGDILTEPMRIHGLGASPAERAGMARALLDKVGLPSRSIGKYPHEFSGGQRQRIAIARCLTMQPDLLICDESVSALDVSVQAQVLNLLQDLQDEFGMSYLFISHDLAVVKHISDQVMVMSDGRVVEMADSDTLYRQPAHPYTQRLLLAQPRIGGAAGPSFANMEQACIQN